MQRKKKSKMFFFKFQVNIYATAKLIPHPFCSTVTISLKTDSETKSRSIVTGLLPVTSGTITALKDVHCTVTADTLFCV